MQWIINLWSYLIRNGIITFSGIPIAIVFGIVAWYFIKPFIDDFHLRRRRKADRKREFADKLRIIYNEGKFSHWQKPPKESAYITKVAIDLEIIDRDVAKMLIRLYKAWKILTNKKGFILPTQTLVVARCDKLAKALLTISNKWSE